jgi:hypothetical protein
MPQALRQDACSSRLSFSAADQQQSGPYWPYRRRCTPRAGHALFLCHCYHEELTAENHCHTSKSISPTTVPFVKHCGAAVAGQALCHWPVPRHIQWPPTSHHIRPSVLAFGSQAPLPVRSASAARPLGPPTAVHHSHHINQLRSPYCTMAVNPGLCPMR